MYCRDYCAMLNNGCSITNFHNVHANHTGYVWWQMLETRGYCFIPLRVCIAWNRYLSAVHCDKNLRGVVWNRVVDLPSQPVICGLRWLCHFINLQSILLAKMFCFQFFVSFFCNKNAHPFETSWTVDMLHLISRKVTCGLWQNLNSVQQTGKSNKFSF